MTASRAASSFGAVRPPLSLSSRPLSSSASLTCAPSPADFVLRRLLRGDSPFQSAPPPSASPLESLNPFSPSASTASSASSALPDTPSAPASAPIPSSPSTSTGPTMNKAEVGRILLAGGLAGALSAIVPYPFDIVKTRLQTANFETRARTSPAARAGQFTSNATPFHTRAGAGSAAPGAAGGEGAAATAGAGDKPKRLTVPGVFRGIHADGVAAQRYRYPSSVVYQVLSTWVFPARRVAGQPVPHLDARAEKWALRLLGLQGFATGIRPTVVSSFVGSAATISASLFFSYPAPRARRRPADGALTQLLYLHARSDGRAGAAPHGRQRRRRRRRLGGSGTRRWRRRRAE